MGDPVMAKSSRSGFSFSDTMLWVAGLAALAGLIEEVIRRTMVERGAGLVGAILVLYVVYLSLSVRMFWHAPQVVVPTTLLISGVLWTLALQLLDRGHFASALASITAVPFATAFLIRRIFPRLIDPDDVPEDTERPLTVHFLLCRNKRFGPRSTPVKPSVAPEL